MLQSGQADLPMLAEALIKEYYAPVYRLALSLLDNADAAQQATIKAFNATLMHVYGYRSETGVDLWVYQFVLGVCKKAERWLNLKRAFNASLGWRARPTNYGISIPTSSLDAELWLAVDGLKAEERLITVLYHAHGWKVEQIARLLKVREGTVHARLRGARLVVEKALEVAGIKLVGQGIGDTETAMSRSLQARWPEVQFSDDEFERAFNKVANQASKHGQARQRTIRLKEVVMTGVGIVVAVVLIYGVDRSLPQPAVTQTPEIPVAVAQSATPELQEALPTPIPIPTDNPKNLTTDFFYIVQPGDTLRKVAIQLDVPVQELRVANRLPLGAFLKPGQALYVPPNQPDTDIPTPTVVPTEPLQTPLSQPYDLVSVLAKMQQFDWNHESIWLDAQSLNLGPPGYIGPPQVRRIQTWLSQSQLLMLDGTLDGTINNVWLRTSGGLYRANPEVNLPWFFDVSSKDMSQDTTVRDMFSLFSDFTVNLDITKEVKLKVVGGDVVSGRQAVILERRDLQDRVKVRFWVDAQTGFLLRVQQMDDADPKIVRKDIVVTSIAYHVNFPQELFNAKLPWRGGFAQDYSGQPETPGTKPLVVPGRGQLPTNLSQPGFDASKSSLLFQYPSSFSEQDPQALVEVLADKKYLGNIMFGNPWTMICGRSPDGNRIAFVSQPFLSPNQDAFLNWFSLSDKSKGQMSLGGLYVTNFAFAPDSRRLALFGFDGQFAEGGVYVLDTETAKYNQLIWLLNARSLVWSPDGIFLALIGTENSISGEETIVMFASTGEVVYRGPAPNDQPPVGAAAPINLWGVPFPTKMGGLEACTAAPAK